MSTRILATVAASLALLAACNDDGNDPIELPMPMFFEFIRYRRTASSTQAK